jgi:hypothetical protein
MNAESATCIWPCLIIWHIVSKDWLAIALYIDAAMRVWCTDVQYGALSLGRTPCVSLAASLTALGSQAHSSGIDVGGSCPLSFHFTQSAKATFEPPNISSALVTETTVIQGKKGSQPVLQGVCLVECQTDGKNTPSDWLYLSMWTLTSTQW